jgi:FAD:protein FMN transferase
MNRFRTLVIQGLTMIAMLAFAFNANGMSTRQLGDGSLDRFESMLPAMGVQFRFLLYARNEAEANAAFQLAAEKVEALENVFSDYKSTSEAMRLVQREPNQPVSVSSDLWVLMRASQQFSQDTAGAFDITVGPVTHLWRLARKRHRLPDEPELRAALSRVGSDGFEMIDPSKVILKRRQMRLDFGGVAKGFAADECLAIFRERGIESALVDASGDIALGAPPPGETGWIVAVEDFDNAEQIVRKLRLSNCGVATSSDARQSLAKDGVRHSHIVDPRTGQAVTLPCSVTVVAENATAADAWATALSVLGPERGMELAESRGNIHSLIVAKVDANKPAVHFETRGFEAKFIDR